LRYLSHLRLSLAISLSLSYAIRFNRVILLTHLCTVLFQRYTYLALSLSYLCVVLCIVLRHPSRTFALSLSHADAVPRAVLLPPSHCPSHTHRAILLTRGRIAGPRESSPPRGPLVYWFPLPTRDVTPARRGSPFPARDVTPLARQIPSRLIPPERIWDRTPLYIKFEILIKKDRPMHVAKSARCLHVLKSPSTVHSSLPIRRFTARLHTHHSSPPQSPR